MKATLEDALQGFASAFKAVKAYKKTVANKLKKLEATLKEKVAEVYELGGKASDAKEVLDAEGIEFNSDTIETYFSALTPADEKQNTGGGSNPAIAKAEKALSEARGEKVAATKQSESINDSMAYVEPFIAKANTEAGNTSAKANASDLEKLEAALEEAKAIQKGARAAATAAAKLVKQREDAIRLYKKASVEAAKVASNAEADKKNAKAATGRRNRKPAKAKAKATA